MAAVATPLELVRQFVANFERKQRNLVKRKSKLDGYRDKLSKGETLNEEQRKAVDGYEGVLQTINAVQEFIAQSKELADDIERSVKYEESQMAVEHERHTLSFLHTHVCLMRLLNALDINPVRMAVARASSENHLKLLDVVRSLVTAPLIDTWPGTSTAALADAPSFLQQQPAISTVAEHVNNFVLGRSIPIPLPSDYDGPHKKFTFKDARILCFRLLATPAIQRSMGLPSRPASAVPSVHEHPVETVEQESEPITSQCSPSVVLPTKPAVTPSRTEVPVTLPQASPDTTSSNIPPLGILDQVIKPLGGTFNFLQASNVGAPDPLMVIQSSVNEVTHSLPVTNGIPEHHHPHFDSHPENLNAEQAPEVTEECYASDSQSKPTTAYSGSVEPHPEFHPQNDNTLHAEEALDLSNEGDAESSAPVSSKPVSYADLVRRPGYPRSAQNVSAPTEPRKRESFTGVSVDPEASDVQNDFNTPQSVPQGNRPSYGRGTSRGRGEFRGGRGGTNRGGFGGAQRRGVGGTRGGRYESGSGRGGAPYRGMSTGVPQPTY